MAIPNSTDSTPPKILFVDDEADMAVLIRRKFRRSIEDNEYEFRFAEDGYDALQVLEAEPDIDLLISDIKMPRMDGLTLLSHVQEMAPLRKAVMVSAFDDMENIRTAMNRGAFDFVTKPIDFADLATTITKALTETTAIREAYQQRTAVERVRVNLARYLSPVLVKQLVDTPTPLSLAVERKELSCIFTDLAGFTPLMEKPDLSAIVPVLNEYFGEMVGIAFKHEGTIDKVVGDGLNVFFGAPVSQPDHAERAIACGLEMDAFATRFAKSKRQEGVPLGATRIGINTGEVFVGNFGCDALLHYTVYGDAVNAAARLEAANKQLGTRVCVSERTVAQAPDFSGIPIGSLVLKGKSQHLPVYWPIDKKDIESAAVDAYIKAYRLLEEEDSAAAEALESVVKRYPELRLAAFHLKRLRVGQSGTKIVVSEL
jgi:adenylate cyclase